MSDKEKFYCDAAGRYLGSFIGTRRMVPVKTGERDVTGLVPVTVREKRLVPVTVRAEDGTPSVTLAEREFDEPVIDDVPVRDGKGEPIYVDDAGNPTTKDKGKLLIARTPRLARAVVGKEPIFELQPQLVAAEVPEGAVEVPAPPPGLGYLWRDGAWVRDPARAWRVSKATVVRRLKEAGKLVAANAALNGAETPAAIELAETWYAAESVRSDDARARAFLTAIGADVEAILAEGDA